MALPRPINWLQKPAPPYTNTTVYEEKIRRLELENFELRNRITAAGEGLNELQTGLESMVTDVTDSFQQQLESYRNTLGGIADILQALADAGNLIPAPVLTVIAEQIRASIDTPVTEDS
jgi:hypothetical protein